jgi:hypothetical protein
MDKDFSSGSLTGYVLLASPYWAPPLRTCRTIRATSYQTRPATGLRSTCRRPANASRCRYPPTHPPFPFFRRPARPTLDRSVAPPGPRRGVAGIPTGRLAAALRPGAATAHPPGTVPADQFLVRTPGSGWPTDGHGGTADRPAGRTSQSNAAARPMGTDATGLRASRGGHRQR